MTWTYSIIDLATSTKDQVRLLIGDTQPADPLLQDEEIAYLLVANGGPYTAAWQAAETIAAGFARAAQTQVGDLSLQAQQKFAQYKDLAGRLRRKMVAMTVTPYVGGLSQSDKQIDVLNVDRVPPAFTVDMQNYPGTTVEPGSDYAGAVPPVH